MFKNIILQNFQLTLLRYRKERVMQKSHLSHHLYILYETIIIVPTKNVILLKISKSGGFAVNKINLDP